MSKRNLVDCYFILGEEIVDETDNVANLRKYARQRWTKSLKKVEDRKSEEPEE